MGIEGRQVPKILKSKFLYYKNNELEKCIAYCIISVYKKCIGVTLKLEKL